MKRKSLGRHWPEMVGLLVFFAITAGSLVLPLAFISFGSSKYGPAFNAAQSIGTGGVVSFLFYYLVNYRSDLRRRNLLRGGVQKVYSEAKENIAVAVIQASRKGGRKDLRADRETINMALTVSGFRSLFEKGRQADEGFYAFQNEMSERTSEYDDIIFALRMISRATDRLVDVGAVDDRPTYDFIVWLNSTIERIERNGLGYDESKLLSSFIWQMFAGWNHIDGNLGHDPIQRVIDGL